MEHNVFFPNFKYIFFTISPPPNLHKTTSQNERMRNHTRENEPKKKLRISSTHTSSPSLRSSKDILFYKINSYPNLFKKSLVD